MEEPRDTLMAGEAAEEKSILGYVCLDLDVVYYPGSRPSLVASNKAGKNRGYSLRTFKLRQPIRINFLDSFVSERPVGTNP